MLSPDEMKLVESIESNWQDHVQAAKKDVYGLLNIIKVLEKRCRDLTAERDGLERIVSNLSRSN